MRALIASLILTAGCAVRPANEGDLARGPIHARNFEPDVDADWGVVLEPRSTGEPALRPPDVEPRSGRR